MLKNNLNNGLQPESSFYRLVNTKACYKTLKLTSKPLLLRRRERSARLQKTEIEKAEEKFEAVPEKSINELN